MAIDSRIPHLLVAVFSAAITAMPKACALEPNNNNAHPKVALVLGGGGTRGCAHVGVLKVFQQAGVPIDFVVGTSMGAAVGGLYAAGCTPDQIEKMILDKSMMRAFDTVPIKMRVALTPVFFVPRMLGHHTHEGLYRGDKFCNYVNGCSINGTEISQFKRPFDAIATDLLSGKPVILKNGDLGKVVKASCAVPLLRRPVQIDGKLLTDGGIIANLPVRQAHELDADIVIAVDVNETIANLPDEYFRHLGSVSRRCSSIMLDKADQYDAAAADVLVKPLTNGIYLLSRKRTDAIKGIAAGEVAAREALPKIQQILTDKGVLAKSQPGVFQTAEYRAADKGTQETGQF